MMLPFGLFGQTYSALWRKVSDAEQKDLPKTQQQVLQEIVSKARRENAYGQLLKAELKSAQVKASVSPDSLMPAVKALEKQWRGIKDDVVLKTVYQTVLWQIWQDVSSPDDLQGITPPDRPELTPALCQMLAQVKDETYAPFVVEGADSRLFSHDLLSVVGFALGDYWPLSRYYESAGRRGAECLTALKAVESEDLGNGQLVSRLDSLITRYEDLPEAGEVAVKRYEVMSLLEKTTVAERVEYAREAIGRWPGCRSIGRLQNAVSELTAPMFSILLKEGVALPQREQTVEVTQVRNLKTLQMKVYAVKGQGDLDLNPTVDEDYKRLKPLLRLMPDACSERHLTDDGRKDYTVFSDSLVLAGLPVGVYMLEFSSQPSTRTVRRMYYVTDVYTMAEEQPDGRTRYVVVSATTGQPIAKAHVRVREYESGNKYNTRLLTTDARGECFFTGSGNRRREVFAYTDSDKASPEQNLFTRYNYRDGEEYSEQTCLFADRAIYRPGQTVHVAATIYEVRRGSEQTAVEGKQIAFELRDANFKEVQRVEAVTDRFGTCAVSLTLPASGVTGRFSVRANGETLFLRVEEYKRPTFEVSFDAVKEHYQAGDTVSAKATARSYAGVPVQGAKVRYKVVRRLPFWWWSYSRYWDTGYVAATSSDEEVASGETLTAEDGTFTVSMPMVMPESRHPLFYNFVVTADVTDQGGETRTASYSLPLGNRKTALSIDVGEKMLAESKPTLTIYLRNAAGNAIDAQVRYRIDGGDWATVAANTSFSIPPVSLKSGRHTVEADYEGQTVERAFVVFSLDDQRPATETNDWFWVSDTSFPGDGKPVTIQVGSSARDVHIVYSIFSGKTCIEQGSVDKSNSLINRRLKYKAEWGNGIVMTFAWVKENQCYTHTATIRRPLPDKRLKMAWKTFRDRLTPGQQEEWTLTVTGPDDKPADAMLMAVLYDKSLDQLASHNWYLSSYVSLPLPSVAWGMAVRRALSFSEVADWKSASVSSYSFSRFDGSVYPSSRSFTMRGFGRYNRFSTRALGRAPMKAMAAMDDAMMADAVVGNDMGQTEVMAYAMKAKEALPQLEEDAEALGAAATEEPMAQLRENLNETAFFYPQLTTDKDGVVSLKFTLPESLTTWRFMGLAHTTDMCHGLLEGETVARKDVMIQPNMPRFVRQGDEAVVSARIFNTGDKDVTGKAVIRLLDPETETVVYEASLPFSVAINATTAVSFHLQPSTLHSSPLPLLICQVSAQGEGFSDGEQHYLPVLPNTEHVTVTLPFTQNEAGQKHIDLTAIIPADGKNARLTFEYTNNPAWLMIQALPAVGQPADDDAVSQAASLYANMLGRHILAQNPDAKKAFRLWKQEETMDAANEQRSGASSSSLLSSLSKNGELKDLLLNETPWVLDAERETEQKQRLADFFDDNLMQQRLSSAVKKLKALQRPDGAWSWWPGMPGSFYMTVAVSEMLVRLNVMTALQHETAAMLDGAFRFMGSDIVEMVSEMKRAEKKHQQSFPSFKALQWLYLSTLDGRQLPSDVEAANRYLLGLLKKEARRQSIYEKAMTAVILAASPLLSDDDRLLAREYAQSLKEYTVFREETGRYYDTPRAGYSWYDYKIPTQTMAIEALQRIAPDDSQTIREMQRWLLQSKRTQAWDTPINSVNAVYAFLSGAPLALSSQQAVITVDGQPLEMPKATAAIGYVKAPVAPGGNVLTVEKSSGHTSWGAVYAQFMQPARHVADTGSGLRVARELITKEGQLKVGDRLTVRITIEADRDYDFVQVIDRRAACLEPVQQLSGYHSGSYCTPRDNTTNYYFDRLSKGRHVIDTEYYVDRPGTYETGTCTVGCAYAPEFRGTTGSKIVNVKP